MPAITRIEAVVKAGMAQFVICLSRNRAELVATLLVFTAYTIVIWVAFQSKLLWAAMTGVANTIPVVIFALISRHLIIKHLIGRHLRVQVVGHAALCVGFSLASYWLLIVMLGVANSPSPLNFVVTNMVVRGMAWQTLQNVTTYALIAALTYLQEARRAVPSDPLPVPKPLAQKEPARLLVRRGEELRPIDLDRIVSIAGADDYAELSTMDGKHLVAMTLVEFEATLDPAKFVRVHRSRIVNLDFVDRAEPAGAGRLLVHMRNGEKVSTSRAGAQILKSRVI
jgi:two-component system, LytTR family, response regulator